MLVRVRLRVRLRVTRREDGKAVAARERGVDHLTLQRAEGAVAEACGEHRVDFPIPWKLAGPIVRRRARCRGLLRLLCFCQPPAKQLLLTLEHLELRVQRLLLLQVALELLADVVRRRHFPRDELRESAQSAQMALKFRG